MSTCPAAVTPGEVARLLATIHGSPVARGEILTGWLLALLMLAALTLF